MTFNVSDMAAFGPRNTEIRPAARAIDDLRRGWAVRITHTQAHNDLLIIPVETLRAESLTAFKTLGQAYLGLTQQRATLLKVNTAVEPAVLLPISETDTPEQLCIIADPSLDLSYPLKGPFHAKLSQEAGICQEAAHAGLSLLKLARLLPGAIIAPVNPNTGPDVLNVPLMAISSLMSSHSQDISPVIETLVQLESAQDCRIQVFRPDDGSEEHLALIIGSPDFSKPTLTRIHSSCLTGDIFGSLRCDCGPQLRGALKTMSEKSGVILYLQQEGRGIGFLNKMRAYTLQHQGHDTVDANEKLGFHDDERNYQPAKVMLDKLGISEVRLLTNNPNKVTGLEKLGVKVTERVPHHYPSNSVNAHYLETKAKRSGHYLPVNTNDEDI